MTLQQMARKLRAAADLLDELAGLDRPTKRETPAVAALIKATLKRQQEAPLNGHTAKGFKYRKGAHWTQTPAGKKKMAAIQRKAWVAKKRAAEGGAA